MYKTREEIIRNNKLIGRSIAFETIGAICSIVSMFSAGYIFGTTFGTQVDNRVGYVVNASALVTFVTTKVLDKRNDKELKKLDED